MVKQSELYTYGQRSGEFATVEGEWRRKGATNSSRTAV
jgi:hypothetical protein